MTESVPLHFQNVSKWFGPMQAEPFYACRNLSFQVKKGEVVAIVGETGCGKSTTLHMLLGLMKPSEGEVRVFGHDPTVRNDALRGVIGIVFQNDRLLPWRTAVENVWYGLEVLRRPVTERLESAMFWLERVGLKGFEGAYPHELSGGMRQRVAIARAFAISPKFLCADEAFTALDELTAARVRKDLLQLMKQTQITTLFITHSISEAVEMAHRILVFARPGRLVCEISRDQLLSEGKTMQAIEELVREALRAARLEAVTDVQSNKLVPGASRISEVG